MRGVPSAEDDALALKTSVGTLGGRRARERQKPAGRAAAEAQVVVVEKAEAVGDVERAAPRAQRLRDGDHVAVGVHDRKRRRPAADSLGRRVGGRVRSRSRADLLRIDPLEERRRRATDRDGTRDSTSHNAGSAMRGTLIAHAARTRSRSEDSRRRSSRSRPASAGSSRGSAASRSAWRRSTQGAAPSRSDDRGNGRRAAPLDGAVLGEVVEGDEAAVLRHVVGNAPRNGAAVERVARRRSRLSCSVAA